MKIVRLISTLVLSVWLIAPVFAQTQAPVTQSAPDGFIPMSSTAPREVLPATPLVFFAYAFVWLALIVYVFSIWKRMARVEQDLADVKRRLKDGPGGR
jgi:hypothetical protein